jgi:hypothetical protein
MGEALAAAHTNGPPPQSVDRCLPQTARFALDVHYNMGVNERAEKKDGIMRPYSFRVV